MTDSINDYAYNVFSGNGTVLTQSVKSHVIDSYTGTVTIPTSDTVTNGTLASTINGIIRSASLTTVAMEDTDSTNLIIQDSSGGTLWSTGTTAESATTNYGTMTIPIGTTCQFVAIAEGTQSAAKKPTFTVLYEK